MNVVTADSRPDGMAASRIQRRRRAASIGRASVVARSFALAATSEACRLIAGVARAAASARSPTRATNPTSQMPR